LFAIIRTGGKQYRAEVGRELVIEKLGASVGDAVTFEEVLLLGPDPVRVGRPLLAGASVAAEVVSQERGEKVVAIRYKAKKDLHKRRGHRQHLTRVRITAINAEGPRKSTGAEQKKAKASQPVAEKTAA
jgi:large subunit ribosomal protein L21